MSVRVAVECRRCGKVAARLAPYCGAKVCGACGHHNGLARCYCGWAENGGDGYRQLVEDGETIEPEEGQ